jgi:Bacterial regulatory protein, arsR family
MLAAEADVSPSTASSHLHKLLDAGLLSVEAHGRNRFYRLANPRVGQLLDLLTQLAPAQPIRSLRQGTRATRCARPAPATTTSLNVELMRSMIETRPPHRRRHVRSRHRPARQAHRQRP